MIPPRLRPASTQSPVFEAPDLVIYASPETPVLSLEEERGVWWSGACIDGSEFRRGRSTAMSLSESRHAAWSRGRALLDDKWGGYVAFLRDEQTLIVLRDPSGAVPAYHLRSAGVQLYVSHPELLGDLRLDERCASTRNSCDSGSPIPSFGRRGLALRAGRSFCRGRSGGRAAARLRSPTPGRRGRSGPERQIDDFDEAARRVREVALATVSAQIADLRAPVLEFSGGLDSSIVAACLKAAGLHVPGREFRYRDA